MPLRLRGFTWHARDEHSVRTRYRARGSLLEKKSGPISQDKLDRNILNLEATVHCSRYLRETCLRHLVDRHAAATSALIQNLVCGYARCAVVPSPCASVRGKKNDAIAVTRIFKFVFGEYHRGDSLPLSFLHLPPEIHQ